MENLKTYRATLNPFRPGSGLFPPCLAGRSLDAELFSNKLYSTITGTPKNIIVYGNQRMGKTSLLMRMERMAEEKKLLTVSMIGSPMSLKDFFGTLAVRFFAETRNQGFVDKKLEDALQEFQGKPQNSSHEIEIAFTDFVTQSWNLIRNQVPAIVFSIDDLDLVEKSDQVLLLLQSITKVIYRKDCPIIFVTCLSVKLLDKVRKKNKELHNYFELVKARKLKASSLINAIRVPLWDLNIPFDESVVKEIARRSDGFPFYLQAIAHHVFEEMEGEFDTLALRRGYSKAIQVLERDLFLPLYTGITPTERKIYLEIFDHNEISFTEILKGLKIPRGSVASSLKRLREKQLIYQNQKIYRVSDKLFGSYLDKKLKEGKQKGGKHGNA